MNSLRFTCTRCGNCCTDKNTLVNLTYLDILRIKNSLDLNLSELLDILGFYIFEKPLTYEDKKRMIITPIETERGLAFIALLKNNLGGCYFYSSKEKRCLIYKIRPMFCQTFPFSFKLLESEKKANKYAIDIYYTEKGKEYCPGIGDEAPLIELDYWIDLGRRALEELQKNHRIIEEWNNSVKNGKITPTIKEFILLISKITDY